MILAIDTSSVSGSVALCDGARTLAEINVIDAGPHAGWLMDGIEELTTVANTPIKEIDALALSVGPGSFTGLRIGVSTVKGLAWSLGVEIFGVSTLKAMALNHREHSGVVAPIIDARKKEVYGALYRFSQGEVAEILIEECAISPAEFAIRIKELVSSDEVLFTGSALSVYGDFFIENMEGCSFAEEAQWGIKAANINELASEEGCVPVSAELLVPKYLRKSEAEIKKAQKG